jgi:hypothetical protein
VKLLTWRKALDGDFMVFLQRRSPVHLESLFETLLATALTEDDMLDLLFLLVGLAFFLAAIAYTRACDRL